MNIAKNFFHSQIVLVGALLSFSLSPVKAQSSYDPSTTQTFEQAHASMQVIRWWNFGTAAGSTITNLEQLATVFNPYGIAAQTVTHQEWERYQPFNSTNFVFTPNSLDITATIPGGGGLYPGGINSGQIWSKDTFVPGRTGYNVYAMLVRFKVPSGVGMWSQSWLYTAQGTGSDNGSEIDNPEFMNMQWQNQFDWTGFNHGPNVGSDIYSVKTNAYVWQPGLDFSAAYHDYELIWTPDATFKYVDGTLIEAQYFNWTSSGSAQLGVALAVGSNEAGATGLQPNSLSEFPSKLSLEYIGIWAK